MALARKTARVVWAALVGSVLTAVTSGARAEEFEYRYVPEWRRFGLVDYAVTAGIVAGYAAFELSTETGGSATWTTPLPLDRSARRLLVASTRRERERFDRISDILWYGLVAYSVADAAVVPLVRGWNLDASLQLTMMNVQAYAVASLLVRVPHKLLGRTRPLVEGCREDPLYAAQCDSPGRFLSFPGGHSTISTTAAGLICAHHLFGELYGNVTADAVSCVTAVLATSVVGVARMRSDKHWLSDQLPGMAVGFSAGFALPAIAYYRGTPRRTAKERAASRALSTASVLVLPSWSPETLGLTLILSGA
jgi:membrane-associated phospholipid phosphatase